MMHPDTRQTLERSTRGRRVYDNRAEMVVLLIAALELIGVLFWSIGQ